MYGITVRSREIRDRLSIRKIRCRSHRRSSPAAEYIAGTRVGVAGERLGLTAVKVLIRHVADHIAAVLLEGHIVLLLTVNRVDGNVTRHRLVKAIRRAIRLLPVIKDVIRLVIRVRGFCRHCAVRNLIVRRDNPVLMTRIRIRRIRDRNRVAVNLPDCDERCIRRHRITEMIRRTVRLCPVLKVIACLVAGRTIGPGRISRCNDRIAVAYRLRIRRTRTAIRVEADIETRQLIIIAERKISRDCCCCAAVLLHACRAVHSNAGLAHPHGNLIDCRIVCVTCRCPRYLCEAVNIIALIDEVNRTESSGSGTVNADLRLLCTDGAVRHRQCTRSRCGRADRAELEAEGFRIQRRSLSGCQGKTDFSGQKFLHTEIQLIRCHRCPNRIERYSIAVHLCEIHHRLPVCILRARSVRPGCPAAKLIAGSRIAVLCERSRDIIGMLRVRHSAAHIAAVCLIAHRVVIRRIGRMNRLILCDRRTEGIRRIPAGLPATEMIAGLVVRTVRLRGRITVRYGLRRNILIRRGRIRSVVDRDRVGIPRPDCLQIDISRNRISEVENLTCLNVNPMLEVVTCSVARRGGSSHRIAGLRRKMTVFDVALRRRRSTAEVGVIGDAELRQLVIIRKACRSRKVLISIAACLALRRHRKGGTALRHRVLEAVDRLIVGEARSCARKFLQLIYVFARHRKGSVAGLNTAASGREIVGAEREDCGLRPCCGCRHRQCRDAGGRRADCLQFETEGLRGNRRSKSARCCRDVTRQSLLNRDICRHRRCRGPDCIEIYHCAVGIAQIHNTCLICKIHRCASLRSRPARKFIARTCERIVVQVLRHIIGVTRIRHRTARVRRILIVTHRITIRRIDRMNGLIAGDRCAKGVRRV